ncbi:hypothetical protein EMIT0357P_10290 [Pseudomonas marginalis]
MVARVDQVLNRLLRFVVGGVGGEDRRFAMSEGRRKTLQYTCVRKAQNTSLSLGINMTDMLQLVLIGSNLNFT